MLPICTTNPIDQIERLDLINEIQRKGSSFKQVFSPEERKNGDIPKYMPRPYQNIQQISKHIKVFTKCNNVYQTTY